MRARAEGGHERVRSSCLHPKKLSGTAEALQPMSARRANGEQARVSTGAMDVVDVQSAKCSTLQAARYAFTPARAEVHTQPSESACLRLYCSAVILATHITASLGRSWKLAMRSPMAEGELTYMSSALIVHLDRSLASPVHIPLALLRSNLHLGALFHLRAVCACMLFTVMALSLSCNPQEEEHVQRRTKECALIRCAWLSHFRMLTSPLLLLVPSKRRLPHQSHLLH